MRREIKFRAWDRANKKMYYDRTFSHVDPDTLDEVEFEVRHISLNDSLFNITKASWGVDNSEPVFISHDYVLMQYTGLKDKNGTDVYEGDILRVPAMSEYEEKTYNSFEVFWHDNDSTPTDCGLVLGRLTPHGNSAGGHSGYKLKPEHVGKMEVIGNVYENSDLLERK